MIPVPAICWDESLSPMQERAMAEAVLRLIRQQQAPNPSPPGNCYLFIPNPVPYAAAGAALCAVAGMAQPVRQLALPKGGRGYGVMGDADCAYFMPQAFRLGPPEWTILALDASLVDWNKPDELTRWVSLHLDKRENPTVPRAVVGLHFDSGDLVEVF